MPLKEAINKRPPKVYGQNTSLSLAAKQQPLPATQAFDPMDLHAPEEVLSSVYVRNLDSNQVATMAQVHEISPVQPPAKTSKDKGKKYV